MPERLNEDIAGRLEEVARLLAAQGADRFRAVSLFRDAHDDEHELQNQDDDDRHLEKLTA